MIKTQYRQYCHNCGGWQYLVIKRLCFVNPNEIDSWYGVHEYYRCYTCGVTEPIIEESKYDKRFKGRFNRPF